MATTKLFKCGNAQAVRIPKDEQIGDIGDEVKITRTGNKIVIELVRANDDWIEAMGEPLPKEFTDALKKRPALGRRVKVG